MAARVSLRARRHRMLGFGGGGIDGGVSADCVAEALLLRGLVLLASRARQLCPVSCGGGRVDDVVLGTALSVQGEQPFKSVLSDAHWSRTRVSVSQACTGLLEGLFASRRITKLRMIIENSS